MPIGDALPEMHFDIIDVSIQRPSRGGEILVLNVQEAGREAGSLFGTMRLWMPSPDAEHGAVDFTGTLGLRGEGYWDKADSGHGWRVRGINTTADGDVTLSEGIVNLAERSYAVSITRWD